MTFVVIGHILSRLSLIPVDYGIVPSNFLI